MSNQFYTKRVGIESLSEREEQYWKSKKIEYKPILEYNPLSKDEEKRLNDEYYVKNNKVGYEKLYASVRKPNGKSRTGKDQYSPTIRQVQAWYAKQSSAQDYKPVQKPKDLKPILVSEINDMVQMDYVVMSTELRFNGYHHILNCIDVLSKRAYSRTMKNQPNSDPTAAQTLVLATQIFDEIKARQGRYPRRLQTDNGSHFEAHFERAFLPGGSLTEIKYRPALRYRVTSMAVVERFNQTLRNMIRRFHSDGNRDWPAHLQQFVSNYNSNRHTMLKLTPDVASDPNPSNQTSQKIQEAKDRVKASARAKNKNSMTLDVGDKVRLVNFKKLKSPQYKDEPNWWPEVHEIYHVFRPRNPIDPLRYALNPNPPTTIVGNRPGYRGAAAKGRRQFSVYELLIIGRKGEAGSDKIKVSTEIEVLGKIDEEEEDTRQTPTKGRKPKAKPTRTAPVALRKRTQFRPEELVGKSVKIKWDNEGVLDTEAVKSRGDQGTFYKAKVLSYDATKRLHSLKYSDGKSATINVSDPKKADYIGKGFWTMA